MKAAETTVFSSYGNTTRNGYTDVQTEGMRELASMPGVTARLTLVHMGPRGGVKVVTALLTDDQRRDLIENLGGTA